MLVSWTLSSSGTQLSTDGDAVPCAAKLQAIEPSTAGALQQQQEGSKMHADIYSSVQ